MLETCTRPATDNEGIIDKHEDGYSSTFYIMLIVGIIGMVGFMLVAAGAGN